ncbi:MAG TPA: hypothetical protein VHV28_15925 [Solirubrobacteraceae bacterium]|nr:hypothetical protein [Solirubrobacteraceae bacterium]
MAPVPDRQSGVPVPGTGRVKAPPAAHALSRLAETIPPARRHRLLLLALAIALLALAWHANAKPRHEALSAIPDALRALAATVVLFGAAGFGLVRVLLPDALRVYEPLWILPTGACVAGLALTVLGFAHVPYAAGLALVLAGGLGLGAYAVRRRGWPELDLKRLGWPVLLMAVVTFVALVPMLLAQHYAAPIGTGSDAHVAAGTAQFLKHAYPTSVNVSQPINQMPPTWQSKYPIYYAFAAVSSLSGLATWQVLATLAAAMLGLAAAGMFLVAREVLRAPVAAALIGMVAAGLDREALHTILNPYFNQTWGFFAMPFTLVLGWWVVQPGLGRRQRQATALLLALFALVLVFAYPLAAPIPAVPIAVFVWREWRRKLRAGEPVFHPRDLYDPAHRRRSLLWLIPVCALLVVPAIGVGQKVAGAIKVLAPGNSLQSWGGDLPGFIPFNYFVSLPRPLYFVPATVIVFALAAYGLRRSSRSLALGLGGLMAIGILLSVYLRHRAYGYYFHFKLLAFIGPLVMVMAAAGAAHMRRWGPALLALLVLATAGSAVAELDATGSQLPQATIQLAGWARALPRDASIRLDMWPPDELWTAYFLSAHRLCSQLPLLDTDYPHVMLWRKADFIVATIPAGRPPDAIGPVLRRNSGYRLYRENPAVPGPDTCTQRRFDRIYTGAGFNPR